MSFTLIATRSLTSGLEQVVLQEQFQFRADAIAAGHHHRFSVSAEIVASREQPEGAEELAIDLSPPHVSADVPYQSSRLTRVHSCLLIRKLARHDAVAAFLTAPLSASRGKTREVP
jgi:hypothetical protein